MILTGKAHHVISLSLFLTLLWGFMSGHASPLLLLVGAISVVLVVAIALRMEVVDNESHPLQLNIDLLLSYWLWLLKEVLNANFYVCRLILNPHLPISPHVITIHSSQKTDLGRVILANSITLTPSTICIDVTGDTAEVHALTGKAAKALLSDTMNQKITQLESQ